MLHMVKLLWYVMERCGSVHASAVQQKTQAARSYFLMDCLKSFSLVKVMGCCPIDLFSMNLQCVIVNCVAFITRTRMLRTMKGRDLPRISWQVSLFLPTACLLLLFITVSEKLVVDIVVLASYSDVGYTI